MEDLSNRFNGGCHGTERWISVHPGEAARAVGAEIIFSPDVQRAGITFRRDAPHLICMPPPGDLIEKVSQKLHVYLPGTGSMPTERNVASHFLRTSAKCGLGQSVPNCFNSIIDNFKEEVLY